MHVTFRKTNETADLRDVEKERKTCASGGGEI